MKTLYKFITTGCLFLLITVSCSENFLEIEPFGSLSETTVSTEAGINNVLIGAYAVLANGSYLLSNGIIRGTDEQTIRYRNRSKYLECIYVYNRCTEMVPGYHYYSGVLRCNEVLKLLPKVAGYSSCKCAAN